MQEDGAARSDARGGDDAFLVRLKQTFAVKAAKKLFQYQPDARASAVRRAERGPDA